MTMIVTYLPSWFPGTGFKKTAVEYREQSLGLLNAAHQTVLDAMVCSRPVSWTMKQYLIFTHFRWFGFERPMGRRGIRWLYVQSQIRKIGSKMISSNITQHRSLQAEQIQYVFPFLPSSLIPIFISFYPPLVDLKSLIIHPRHGPKPRRSTKSSRRNRSCGWERSVTWYFW